MLTLSTTGAKYGFGPLIEVARADPVAVGKHGRPVVVLLAVEDFRRSKAVEEQAQSLRKKENT